MVKIIVFIVGCIGLFLAIRHAKKKGEKQVYFDKTTKNYKRWHK